MSKIAFLGTGLLGAGFVEAALKRNDSVTVWNRTLAKAKALEQFGAVVAATPADAVRGAERVHLVLPDDAVVAEVIAALRPGLGKDAVILDHSTTLPSATAVRSAALNASGVNYLHCPVFIGPAAAREAQGIIMVSGPSALFARVKAALERQAARVEYFGERADLAATYKLIGNGMLLGLAGVISDALTIGAANGVSGADTMEVLEYFNPAGVVAGRGKKMAARNYEASFELTMARKDVGLMLSTVGARPLAVLPGMAARMDALIAQGHGREDVGVISVEAVAG